MHRDSHFLSAWARAADDRLPERGPAEPAPARYRSLWISDVHLGTPGCQAEALLDFLRRTECRTLYLVGDIVDGWQLRRRWYWPQTHNDVVQKLLRKARKGTRVIFIPGNHDEFARRYFGNNFGGIEIAEDWIHVTADGLRLWVTHGDQFDGVIQCAKWLAHVGDHLYEFTLRLNARVNSLRARLGLPYWSLSRYLKLKVKRAVSYVGDFETALAREARRAAAPTASSAGTSTTPSCARSAASSMPTTATGSRA
jgi:UDP-2,3-diacylglucosamine pyrophosphatase LpxH